MNMIPYTHAPMQPQAHAPPWGALRIRKKKKEKKKPNILK
jgi:hypothetical protein